MTNWRQVRSSVCPLELDTTSSQSVVYERRNITQEEIINPMNEEETYTEWIYEERVYDKEEYKNLTSPTTQLIMQSISDLECGIAELNA